MVDQCQVGIHFVWPNPLANRFTNIQLHPSFWGGGLLPPLLAPAGACKGPGATACPPGPGSALSSVGREAAILFDKTHTVATDIKLVPTTMIANLVIASFNDTRHFGKAASSLSQSNGRAFIFEGDAGNLEVSGLAMNNAPPANLWAASVGSTTAMRVTHAILHSAMVDDFRIEVKSGRADATPQLKTDDSARTHRVYPAVDAHAPSCEPNRDRCERIRFVVRGSGSAANANLVLRDDFSSQTQVSATVNGHFTHIVNVSNHLVYLDHGMCNTILYTFSKPVSIRDLHIDQHDDASEADFVTYEAEDAKCTGTVIGYELQSSIAAENTPLNPTIVSESSQRKACQLTKAGQFVELKLSKPGNFVDVRFSIPNGTVADLKVAPAGEPPFSLALTTNYSWSYTSGVGIPGHQNKKGRHAHRFYDQVSAALLPQLKARRRLLPAGTLVRFSMTTKVPITIDLVDVFNVPAPFQQPVDFVSVVDHGADPTGEADSWQAFTSAVALANTSSSGVWIPKGSFQCNRTVAIPSNMIIRGSGPFTSAIYKNSFIGHNSLNVTVIDLSIDLQRSKRGGPAGLEGSFGGGSLFQNLRVAHTGVCIGYIVGNDALGTAAGSPHHDTHWVGVWGHNSYAGGIVHRGFSGVTVESCHIRYPGDDGVALWSGDNDANTNHNCVVRNNHISLNIGGCGISIYGGDKLLLAGNILDDTTTAINICNGRFSPVPLVRLHVSDTEINRAMLGIGFETTISAYWNTSNVTIQNVTIRDSLSSAIAFAGNVSDGFLWEHRIPSATNESNLFNHVGFSGISLYDVAIQGAKCFGLVLGGTGRASFNNVTTEHLGAGDTFYCPKSCGAFVIEQVGSAWVKETGCKLPKRNNTGCRIPVISQL